VRVGEQDAEGRKKLAGYMLRAPMSLDKMTYDAETGTVIYRSMMHTGLKRNFQVMPGAEWLELLCHHIPIATSTSFATLGGYSNRARGQALRKTTDERLGERARALSPSVGTADGPLVGVGLVITS
jgi:hypothetical protein